LRGPGKSFLNAVISKFFLVLVRRLIDSVGIDDKRIEPSIFTDPAE